MKFAKIKQWKLRYTLFKSDKKLKDEKITVKNR